MTAALFSALSCQVNEYKTSFDSIYCNLRCLYAHLHFIVCFFCLYFLFVCLSVHLCILLSYSVNKDVYIIQLFRVSCKHHL